MFVTFAGFLADGSTSSTYAFMKFVLVPICAVAGPDKVLLCSPVPLDGHDFTHTARFEINAGDRMPFVLTHALSHVDLPARIDPEAELIWPTGAR